MTTSAFDDLTDVYEALVDWPKRLANEAPFYRALFERLAARRVLDVACGTGHHAAMFHEWGLEVEGADISPAMIARARQHVGESDTLHWTMRGFEVPVPAPGAFDVALCVGNSLALAPGHAVAEQAVTNMLAAVRPGGAVVIQVLNLWRLADNETNWQKCQRVTLADGEHILVKGVRRSGTRGYLTLIDLNIAAGRPVPRYDEPSLLGLEAAFLEQAAQRAGAKQVVCYGDFQHAKYERDQSPDLILVAEK